MTTTEMRIDELEMRMAHQEQTIGELNEIITTQWKRIESLERRLQRLDEEMQAVALPDATPNKKPPHY